MLGLIVSAIGLASKVMEVMAVKNARKYVDDLVRIKKELLAEETKGYWSDDKKIETLYAELKITMEAIQNEIAIGSSHKP